MKKLSCKGQQSLELEGSQVQQKIDWDNKADFPLIKDQMKTRSKF